MFYYISGTIALKAENFAVIDAGGVGYKLTISGSTHAAMPHRLTVSEPPEVKLYSYMAVREDGVELFGFASEEELSSFKLLITVSGVGPKAAISILSQLTPSRLVSAICADDKKAIAAANGIGPKTAARIVLELKDKMSKNMMSSSQSTISTSAAKSLASGNISEACEALMVLGYDKNTILSVVKDIDPMIEVGEIIKQALKKLTR